MDESRILEIFDETGVRLTGHFLLTSGRHSDTYMQCAHLFKYPKYSEMISKELADKFSDIDVDVVVGPALGGIILAYEVSRQMGVPNMFAERDAGQLTFRRGFEINPGDKVLIVEDVVTTGGSVVEVMDAVREAGGEVVAVGVVVDRSAGNVDFGVPMKSIIAMEIVSYPPTECPICEKGLELVKPGSRKSKFD